MAKKSKIKLKQYNLKNYDFLSWNKNTQLLYLAGVFEGEGTYGIWKQGGRNILNFILKVKMTDKDVVQRFAEYCNYGNVLAEKPQTEKHKVGWVWKITGPRALNFASEMFPYLGQRRSAKLLECLSLYKKERNL